MILIRFTKSLRQSNVTFKKRQYNTFVNNNVRGY